MFIIENTYETKILKVKDIQKILGCGKKTAYELIQSAGFPKIIINNRYYIPENRFYIWLNESVRGHIYTH